MMLRLAGFIALMGLAAPSARGAEPPLEEQIGQLLMVGFRGLSITADSAVRRDICERHLGGVVLYSTDVPSGGGLRNIESPQQVRALTKQLRSCKGTPLFIAIDQEGGRVRRLGAAFGFHPEPDARTLGHNDDVKATRRWARTTAAALASLGINVNFAPVVDLDLNPASPAIGAHKRSFSADAERVVRHARAVIEAHREAGVISALKHFPGHGSALADSHAGLPDVTAVWQRTELEPFRRLIGQGLADSVMIAHLFHRELDPEHPATLSKPIMHLLRNELGFGGVVFSDDLQMGAIRHRYGEEEAIRLALLAGVDVLMFSNNSIYDETVVERLVAAVRRMIEQGRLPRDTVTSAYARVMELKTRLERTR